MNQKDLLVALFLLGTALLLWPFLTIVNHPRAVFGVPLLVLYLFGVWAAIIVVLAWLARRTGA